MTKEEEGLTGHEMLEVDARQWWEEARAVILASPGTDEQKQAGIEALGPAPAAGTMIRLDAEGNTVMTSGLEATPSASRATETEPELVNETGQREIAQGVLGDDAEHGIDLVPIPAPIGPIWVTERGPGSLSGNRSKATITPSKSPETVKNPARRPGVPPSTTGTRRRSAARKW
jgi:hypothetical protein